MSTYYLLITINNIEPFREGYNYKIRIIFLIWQFKKLQKFLIQVLLHIIETGLLWLLSGPYERWTYFNWCKTDRLIRTVNINILIWDVDSIWPNPFDNFILSTKYNLHDSYRKSLMKAFAYLHLKSINNEITEQLVHCARKDNTSFYAGNTITNMVHHR